jgi:hypothetical protein
MGLRLKLHRSNSEAPMSHMGLGCVKTFAGSAHVSRVVAAQRRAWDYALIAAMRGWMPMMFITRVRL